MGDGVCSVQPGLSSYHLIYSNCMRAEVVEEAPLLPQRILGRVHSNRQQLRKPFLDPVSSSIFGSEIILFGDIFTGSCRTGSLTSTFFWYIALWSEITPYCRDVCMYDLRCLNLCRDCVTHKFCAMIGVILAVFFSIGWTDHFGCLWGKRCITGRGSGGILLFGIVWLLGLEFFGRVLLVFFCLCFFWRFTLGANMALAPALEAAGFSSFDNPFFVDKTCSACFRAPQERLGPRLPPPGHTSASLGTCWSDRPLRSWSLPLWHNLMAFPPLQQNKLFWDSN